MSEVSSEAVEAVARARYGGSGGWDQMTDEIDERARQAFIEGARWLAALSLRVAPSAEEVAEAVRGVQGVPFVGPKQRKIAAAVLALFASQPTVAQVREQVAREIEADIIRDDLGRLNQFGMGQEHAARIARTETKGGE